ncbi:MAG: hypothetical protein WD749_01725 [Phycisphaerales bacterium]
MIDAIIETLHAARGYFPKELEGIDAGRMDVRWGEYIQLATHLNLLRRSERRVIGARLLDKNALCLRDGNPHHFAHVSHAGVVFLFRVSNEERRLRTERLRFLAGVLIRKMRCETIVGVTYNSPGHVPSSIDGLVIHLNVDSIPPPAPEDEHLYAKFFVPPRAGVSAEHLGTRTPKRRFKERKRR